MSSTIYSSTLFIATANYLGINIHLAVAIPVEVFALHTATTMPFSVRKTSHQNQFGEKSKISGVQGSASSRSFHPYRHTEPCVNVYVKDKYDGSPGEYDDNGNKYNDEKYFLKQLVEHLKLILNSEVYKAVSRYVQQARPTFNTFRLSALPSTDVPMNVKVDVTLLIWQIQQSFVLKLDKSEEFSPAAEQGFDEQISFMEKHNLDKHMREKIWWFNLQVIDISFGCGEGKKSARALSDGHLFNSALFEIDAFMHIDYISGLPSDNKLLASLKHRVVNSLLKTNLLSDQNLVLTTYCCLNEIASKVAAKVYSVLINKPDEFFHSLRESHQQQLCLDLENEFDGFFEHPTVTNLMSVSESTSFLALGVTKNKRFKTMVKVLMFLWPVRKSVAYRKAVLMLVPISLPILKIFYKGLDMPTGTTDCCLDDLTVCYNILQKELTTMLPKKDAPVSMPHLKFMLDTDDTALSDIIFDQSI